MCVKNTLGNEFLQQGLDTTSNKNFAFPNYILVKKLILVKIVSRASISRNFEHQLTNLDWALLTMIPAAFQPHLGCANMVICCFKDPSRFNFKCDFAIRRLKLNIFNTMKLAAMTHACRSDFGAWRRGSSESCSRSHPEESCRCKSRGTPTLLLPYWVQENKNHATLLSPQLFQQGQYFQGIYFPIQCFAFNVCLFALSSFVARPPACHKLLVANFQTSDPTSSSFASSTIIILVLLQHTQATHSGPRNSALMFLPLQHSHQFDIPGLILFSPQG